MPLPEYLPILQGWDWLVSAGGVYNKANPINVTTKQTILDESLTGWFIGGQVTTNNPNIQVKVSIDQTYTLYFTPMTLLQGGSSIPMIDWPILEIYNSSTLGVPYPLYSMGATYNGLPTASQVYADVEVIQPAQLQGQTINTVLEGYFFIAIKITDMNAFIQSILQLNEIPEAPIQSQSSSVQTPPSSSFIQQLLKGRSSNAILKQ